MTTTKKTSTKTTQPAETATPKAETKAPAKKAAASAKASAVVKDYRDTLLPAPPIRLFLVELLGLFLRMRLKIGAVTAKGILEKLEYVTSVKIKMARVYFLPFWA